MRIIITGSTGFLGRHLMPLLKKKYGGDTVIGISSRDYDLLDRNQVRRMFEDLKPEILIHHNHTFIHCEDIVRLQRAGTMLAGLPA